MPADPGYPGMPGNSSNPSIDDTRKFVLWGSLMGGAGGVEYYFGYKLPQNDLVCEDWRSRDRSWSFCRFAFDFFRNESIPVGEMVNADELIGNPKHDNSGYCLAKAGEIYLVYLPDGGSRPLGLAEVSGDLTLQWINPREGGAMSDVVVVNGGVQKELLTAPDSDGDWLAVVKKR